MASSSLRFSISPPRLGDRNHIEWSRSGLDHCSMRPRSHGAADRRQFLCCAGVQDDLAKKDMDIWQLLRIEAMEQSQAEPYLASFLYATVLSHPSLERSLAFHLANKLANMTLLSTQLFSLFSETFSADTSIQEAMREDMKAFRERDPACTSYVHGMLNYKGFLACQAHRVSHRLWRQDRTGLALALQNRISEVFQVDIHPGAQVGKGMFLDHATGVVVGETATIGDNVSILHHVTLGGTGNRCMDRHPKVGNGVLIGAGATLLGPIKVGDGAKIGACTLVLIDVPCYCTAVGVPARIIRNTAAAVTPPPPCDFPGQSMDHTSEILDYVI
ncbi:serine acetyltransferase 5 isoform X1 [Selaginella moellendorffii]|uniref:serine acetyltransferase 5 isoform X1 n=2 Tax=Selaginella moellendorffii TaxID=88036 RepID=UPI000D1CF5CA|nr:serine acetyltransferase 5 isoform X1 [Selaginella moellendorffii]|eukprot:XP_024532874.1 serine acetyltransferase 5 isoform X1 [Selaginella moellendorffii]